MYYEINVVLIFILGLIVGSFSNVCIYRIPKNESIVFPASHCPKCHSNISPKDNIPLLSYILLKGRCLKADVVIVKARYLSSIL